MKTKPIGIVSLFLLMLIGLTQYVLANDGGLESLRSPVQADETSAPPTIKHWKDGAPIARNYVQQPPLIPHKIEGYKIDMKSNKCMTCHSWPKYQEIGATKVSLTHFKDRDGKEMGDISPRRYFCLQCHVPQVEADPLVGNSFKPVQGLEKR